MFFNNNAAIVARCGDIAFASQPALRDLDRWAADGVTLVINSRTPEETASLGFDLAAQVAARGMRYAEMPIGGAWGADPALTAALPGLLTGAGGPVVMHCRSGTRSAHLYAAHRVTGGEPLETVFDAIGWHGGRDLDLVRALIPDSTV